MMMLLSENDLQRTAHWGNHALHWNWAIHQRKHRCLRDMRRLGWEGWRMYKSPNTPWINEAGKEHWYISSKIVDELVLHCPDILLRVGLIRYVKVNTAYSLEYLPFRPNIVRRAAGSIWVWFLPSWVKALASCGLMLMSGPNIGKLYHWSPHLKLPTTTHISDTTRMSHFISYSGLWSFIS